MINYIKNIKESFKPTKDWNFREISTVADLGELLSDAKKYKQIFCVKRGEGNTHIENSNVMSSEEFTIFLLQKTDKKDVVQHRNLISDINELRIKITNKIYEDKENGNRLLLHMTDKVNFSDVIFDDYCGVMFTIDIDNYTNSNVDAQDWE